MASNLVKLDLPVERIEDMLDANFVLIVDTSSSMTERDAGETQNEARYTVMQRVISKLFNMLNGKVVIVWFNDNYGVASSDTLPRPTGCTDMAGPLRFLHQYGFDAFLEKAVLISDGEPTEGLPTPVEAACCQARELACPLDVVYVGPPGGYGEAALRKIAEAGRGTYIHEVLRAPDKLVAQIHKMLTVGKESRDESRLW